MRDLADIIAAIATPPGRGGIGVVRISGPSLAAFSERLLGRVTPARRATLVDFPDAQGEAIDRGIVIRFEGPHSYTGEDVIELQGHGGPAVLAAVLERCVSCGARLAEAGEFTRRAFLNDRIDLVQAESVADLIDASSRAAARSAMRSLSGEFSTRVRGLVASMVDLRVLIEACLDFPEEEIDAATQSQIDTGLRELQSTLASTLAAAGNGQLLREGVHVALVGPPNVGKSSLLNRLVGEDLAIVTPIPGTTRDTVRGSVSIGGIPFHLVDTAGLRVAQDPVEQIGVERSRAAASRADLVILVRDATLPHVAPGAMELEAVAGAQRLDVWNKIDLVGRPGGLLPDGSGVAVSARSGEGIALLQEELLRRVGWHAGDAGAFAARERHVEALTMAARALDRAVAVRVQAELVAEELREAQRVLGTITGEFSADDLLGAIFSRFCIGK